MKDKIKAWFLRPLVQLLCWITAAAMIVLGSLSAEYVKNFAKDDSFTLAHLRKNIDRDINVNEMLRRLLLQMDSDRAWIMFFHNGSATTTGIPFKKMSNIYEATRKGVSVEIPNIQGVPLSSIPEVVDLLIKNNDCIEVWTDKQKNSTFKYMVEAQGIKYMMWHRILQNDSIIGIVGVDYLTAPTNSLMGTSYEGELNMVTHLLEYQFQQSMN